MAEALHIEPTRAAPAAPELAARVTGVALDAPLDPPTLTAIRAAWARHAVLVFPGQRLDAAALIAFSRTFGALEPSPAAAAQRGGAQRGVPPEVWIISNIREAGRPIGALGDAEARWHTDMSYVEVPPRASILHAVEIPPTGGDTSFADMYAAYAALPDELRREVDGAQVHHDATTTSVGERRAGAEAPGWRHPAVRIHPDTGRPALYLGRRHNARLIGRSPAESDALLDRLWAHCAEARFVYTHRWAVGDLVMWDNRCVIHRRDAFAGRRLMLRTQVRGEAVVAAGAGP